MLKSTIFREYDIRGIADSEMESSDVRLLGQALGTFIRRRSSGTRVALGRDVRLSSTRLRDALSAGLAASGCNVIDVGVVPTPVV
jgi:phosphomannomutase/phosphoglucomutase